MTTHQMARHQRDCAFGGSGRRVLAAADARAGDVLLVGERDHGRVRRPVRGLLALSGGAGLPGVARRHRQQQHPQPDNIISAIPALVAIFGVFISIVGFWPLSVFNIVIAAMTLLVAIYDLWVLGGAAAKINRLTDEFKSVR